VAVQRKKYLAPAIFSALIVGLGQALKGDNKKGLKLMVWFYLGFPILIYGALLLNSYIFLIVLAIFVILYPIVWILNIMDAYSAHIPIKRRA
jgi:hypothetical protein